jgi:hypothetical protein
MPARGTETARPSVCVSEGRNPRGLAAHHGACGLPFRMFHVKQTPPKAGEPSTKWVVGHMIFYVNGCPVHVMPLSSSWHRRPAQKPNGQVQQEVSACTRRGARIQPLQTAACAVAYSAMDEMWVPQHRSTIDSRLSMTRSRAWSQVGTARLQHGAAIARCSAVFGQELRLQQRSSGGKVVANNREGCTEGKQHTGGQVRPSFT